MVANNPAGRLYDLLRAAMDIGSPEPHQPIYSVWARTFDLDREDLPAILPMVGQVFGLPSDVRAAVRALPEEVADHELLLRDLHHLEDAMTRISLHQEWAQFQPVTQGQVMNGLEHCAAALKRHAPEPAANESALEQLHVAVRSMLDDLAESTDAVPDELRDYIARHLMEIDRALTLMRIHGITALRDAVEAAVGGVILDPNLAAEFSATDDNPRSVVNRFKKLVVVAVSALTIYTGVPMLESSTDYYRSIFDPPAVSAGPTPSSTAPPASTTTSSP